MLGVCRGRRKFLAASLALLFIPALTWLYLSAANFQVKPVVPLSVLDSLSPSVLGLGAGERQALESRVRQVEEENRVLRRELSLPPRPLPPTANHTRQSYAAEEGTGDSEGLRPVAPGNASDCAQKPPVDKCEVSRVGGVRVQRARVRGETQ
ncbi:hypothetical protein GJAV_G00272310 [Gymnothorax javanicus]|nr:hypothetical protein GJAV_G00272310 [Gymnothorax javanicus]